MYETTLGNDLVLGTDGRGRKVVMKAEDRLSHVYCSGGTGVGKSSLIAGYIRSDILAWPQSRSGFMLIDPHGKLYDDTLAWIAAENLKHLPIVPIDLRRIDSVVAFNLLRRRSSGDPAAIVGGFVKSILHSWGQSNSDATPRLEKWLYATLISLYYLNGTLLDILAVINSRDMRKAIAEKVEDVVARRIWEASLSLKDNEFQQEIESTTNRLRRLISTRIMRASLCQTDVSLDLSAAIEKGLIVLVSLASQGSQVDEQDAHTFAAMLLSDLWTAAKARGKRDGLKPFYVFCDEFQSYLSPSIAKALDQSRGFAIGMHLVQQYPRQCLVYGQEGQAILNSIMANCRTKLIFSLDGAEDLDMLSLWMFRQQVDVDEVKYSLYTTKVLGHDLRYLPGYSSSTSVGESNGTNWSRGIEESQSHSTQWSHTDTETLGTTVGTSDTESSSVGMSLGTSSSYGYGSSNSEQESDGTSDSEGSGRNRSRSTNVGYNYPANEHLLDARRLHEVPDGPDSAFESSRDISISENRSEGDSDSQGRSRSRSLGRSRSHSEQHGLSQSIGYSEQHGLSHGSFESVSSSVSSADTYGESETRGFSQSLSRGGSKTESTSVTNGTSWSPVLVPRLGQELSGVQFRSVQDQLFRFSQFIAGQPRRRFFARIVGCTQPVQLTSVDVSPPQITDTWVERWTVRSLGTLPFALPIERALLQIDRQEQRFSDALFGRNGDKPGEAVTAVRPLRKAGKSGPQD